jgi:hypothetical protein
VLLLFHSPADYKRERDNEGKEVKFNKVHQHPPVHKEGWMIRRKDG